MESAPVDTHPPPHYFASVDIKNSTAKCNSTHYNEYTCTDQKMKLGTAHIIGFKGLALWMSIFALMMTLLVPPLYHNFKTAEAAVEPSITRTTPTLAYLLLDKPAVLPGERTRLAAAHLPLEEPAIPPGKLTIPTLPYLPLQEPVVLLNRMTIAPLEYLRLAEPAALLDGMTLTALDYLPLQEPVVLLGELTLPASPYLPLGDSAVLTEEMTIATLDYLPLEEPTVLLGKTLELPILTPQIDMAAVVKVSVPPAKICTVDCKFNDVIIRASRRYKVEPEIIKAIIRAESNFNPKAISNKGAMGLMQLMPITAAELGVKDAFNPEHNINGGVRYFKKLLRRYKGNVKLALAAYNAGVLRVKQYKGVPHFKATRIYIEKVIEYYTSYKEQMDRDQADTAVAER